MNEELAAKQLRKIKYCAQKAGIAHQMFLSYGTLLGFVREGGLIKGDHDMDISIKTDKITPEQEAVFLEELNKRRVYPGENKKSWLYEDRKSKQKRPDNGRPLHISLREQRGGVRTCIWFQFPWRNYYWHSKAHIWVNKIGKKKKLPLNYDRVKAIIKGVPYEYFNKLMEVDFLGDKYNIPQMYGSCLDFWYPDFMTPRKGSSKSCVLGIINDWEDVDNWSLMII